MSGDGERRGDGELLEVREIFPGRTVRLNVEKVRLPNGQVANLEIVRHSGAAAVVPVTDDGHVFLVRQYRYATGGYLLEVPAGKLDPGEEPEACARRETEEEIGYRPGKLQPLGWIWATPGFADERIWLYLATGLEPARQELGADEVLSIERMTLAEAVDKAASGEIHDSKSVCALLRVARVLGV